MSTDRLYNLLPMIYRLKDAGEGESLRALLAVIEGELQTIEQDIDALYDNWFIETCDEWVVPYIGELLGIDNLNDTLPLPFSRRSLVARTIAYRRWKGTPATLEHVVWDATGWRAHVVEFFERLAMTQSIRFVRAHSGGTANLFDIEALDALGGAFERAAHNVDISATRTGSTQPSTSTQGDYNIPSVGVFLWRLQSYPLASATPREIQPGCYTFNPFGLDASLFNAPQTPATIADRIGVMNVPAPLRRRPLYDELQARRRSRAPSTGYFGLLPALQVAIRQASDPDTAAPTEIYIADLSDWQRPTAEAGAQAVYVAVDPVLGRLALPQDAGQAEVEVSYSYGFSADMGGGPYDRRRTLAPADPALWQAHVGRDTGAAQDGVAIFASLPAALQAWSNSGRSGIIRVLDSRTYALHGEGDDLPAYQLAMDHPHHLTIEAANNARPCLSGDLSIVGAEADAALTLNGLWIDGAITVRGSLKLNLIHCTLWPTTPATAVPPSLQVLGDAPVDLKVAIVSSIVGPLVLPDGMLGIHVQDSIIDGRDGYAIAGAVDGSSFGPPVGLERTTVLGPVAVAEIMVASDALFAGRVEVQRRHVGFIRFSYVPEGSRTPRRHHCQPDVALERQSPARQAEMRRRLKPSFTSVTYGEPGYAQLTPGCPPEIRAGAEDGSELGAFHHLHQPQREIHLRAILEEYLPYNVQARILFST